MPTTRSRHRPIETTLSGLDSGDLLTEAFTTSTTYDALNRVVTLMYRGVLVGA